MYDSIFLFKSTFSIILMTIYFFKNFQKLQNHKIKAIHKIHKIFMMKNLAQKKNNKHMLADQTLDIQKLY